MAAILNAFDSGNACFYTVFARQQAGEDIDLVKIGNGDEDIDVFNVGLFENFSAGAIAVESHDIEAILSLAKMSFVTIDQGDFMSLHGETLAQEIADLACSDDEYFHKVRYAPNVLFCNVVPCGVDSIATNKAILRIDRKNLQERACYSNNISRLSVVFYG